MITQIYLIVPTHKGASTSSIYHVERTITALTQDKEAISRPTSIRMTGQGLMTITKRIVEYSDMPSAIRNHPLKNEVWSNTIKVFKAHVQHATYILLHIQCAYCYNYNIVMHLIDPNIRHSCTQLHHIFVSNLYSYIYTYQFYHDCLTISCPMHVYSVCHAYMHSY